jgi:hypothetical protein
VQINSSTLIDHICSRNEFFGTSYGTIISDFSDHFINFILIPDKCYSNETKIRYIRNFSHANMPGFRDALHFLGWMNVPSLTDCNAVFDKFCETYYTLFELYFPLKRQKLNKKMSKNKRSHDKWLNDLSQQYS